MNRYFYKIITQMTNNHIKKNVWHYPTSKYKEKP